MNNIYVDIETIPNQSPEFRAKLRENIKPPGNIKKPESVEKWLAENADAATDEAVAKTSFDPAYGHICCIGWAIGDGDVRYANMADATGERAALETFFFNLPELGLHRLIGHNVAAFDLRFILCRAVVLGVPIPTAIPRDIKPWSDQIFDTMTAWAGPRGTISQDNLAKVLGFEGKGDFDGSMVAEAWANGEYGQIARYCMKDVETVRAIHRKFELVGF